MNHRNIKIFDRIKMADTENNENQSADSMLDFNSKRKTTYVSQSKIRGAGAGLFAKKIIHSGQPVVVYYGSKTTDEEVYSAYQTDPGKYREMNSVIRGTPNGYAILGEKNDNHNLHGVYVNDISSLSCTKDELTRKHLQQYVETAKKCNLRTVDTSDYPIYVATKRIKKGEELYAHYGIGYWLLHNGCTPEELTILNQIYKFETFYSQ
jgi:SET domain